MPYISSPDTMTQIIVDKLDANLVQLGLAAVYYGDEELAPEFPVAFCASGPLMREQWSTHKFKITMSTNILLLHGKVQAVETTTKQNQQAAEGIEALLHQDHYLKDTNGDSQIVWGMVSRIDPGVALRRQAVMYQATRIIWEAESREVF